MRVPQWPKPPIKIEAYITGLGIVKQRQANEYHVGPWHTIFRFQGCDGGIGGEKFVYAFHLTAEVEEYLRRYFVRQTLLENLYPGEKHESF